jgi:acetoin utilization protein AcuB
MNNLAIMELTVKDAMTIHPLTVGPLTTIDKAKFIFEENKIHHLPIVDDDGILLGIISNSDVLLLIDWAVRHNQESAIRESNWLLRSQTASELCTKKVVAVYPDETLHNCYEIFKQKEIRALPVINGNSKLVGIITPLDIVTLFFKSKNKLYENSSTL